MKATVATVGPYEVLAELGGGPITVLHLARRSGASRRVVLKGLRPGVGESSPLAAPLAWEGEVLGALCDARVVLLLDRGQEAGRPFLVLEHVEGRSLQAVLDDGGSLAAVVVATLGAEMARGLAYLHGQGVLHRDLQASNVLLGTQGTLKLADLGAARLGENGPPSGEGEVRGAAEHLPPERLQGGREDPRSDLFALGSILRRALGGRALTGREVLLEELITRLLAPRPEHRPSSALDVAEALEALARRLGAPSASRTVGALARGEPLPETHGARPAALRPIALRLGFVGLVIVALGFVLRWNAPRDEAGEPDEGRASAALARGPGRSGGLRVLATPWAEVVVDGQRLDVTPFARPIALVPGTHAVALRHPQAPEEHRKVVVAAGEVALLDVTMAVAIPDGGAP